MKEARLGEFEEMILLLVGILTDEAYALKITEELESQANRSASIGAVHSTLSRLSKKGFLKSNLGEPTAIRGGRRKRIYVITAFGERVLRETRDMRLNLWNQIPRLAVRSI